MTEGGAPRLGVSDPAGFTDRDDVTASLCYVTESHTPHACHIKPHGADGAGFGGQDREKVAPPRALKRAEDSQVFDVACVRQKREYLKKRITYECWAYKKGEGGPFHSSAYKKRYFIITEDQRLSYYDDPECYYQERSPNGKLSCVGMQCTSIYGNEMIEGKECFPFTIQAKEEGLRTRHCACETYDDREKLLASIKGSKGPLNPKPDDTRRISILNPKPDYTRHISIIRESLREKNKKNEVDDKEKVSVLDTLILNKKSTGDVIDGFHHANSSSQAEHPLFKAIRLYSLERLKKLKKADDIQGLADDIIGYCAKREEEDVDVFNIDVPLPCGESPVHLAFLLGQKDLGHDCV